MPFNHVAYAMTPHAASEAEIGTSKTKGNRREPHDGTEELVVAPDFQFVSYDPTSRSKRGRGSSVVRSQAARQSWRQDLPSRNAIRFERGRRRKVIPKIVFEGAEQQVKVPDDEYRSATNSSQSSSGSSRTSSSSASSSSTDLVRAGNNTTPAGSLEWLIGGTRVDPFRSYPARWKPFFPSVVDHCQ